MHRSKIDWVLNPENKTLGWVWNPLTGCRNHTNGMCKGGNFPCYAYRLSHTRLKERYLANDNVAKPIKDGELEVAQLHKALQDPFYPRFWEDRLLDGRDELCGGKPKGIFVCDMSDLFGIGIPEEWTRRVLDVIESRPQHRFYLLTKQLQNLIKFSPFPQNCYVGATATDSDLFACAVNSLMNIQAKVKFVSIEPLLRWPRLDISTWLNQIQWLIIGAQTRPTVMPKIEWVEEIETAARQAGIPIFEKESLKPLFKRALIQELP